MDVKITGTFLKQLRKENNMTQEQLGEYIGVTNKTVSRWETGNYIPPVEYLILLSDIYNISINEILAGKRVENDKIKEVADENIIVFIMVILMAFISNTSTIVALATRKENIKIGNKKSNIL